MSEPRHRKLTAMGIASLVSTARPEVLQRLPTEIFHLWLDVFGELKEAQLTIAAAEENRCVSDPFPLFRFFNSIHDTHDYLT